MLGGGEGEGEGEREGGGRGKEKGFVGGGKVGVFVCFCCGGVSGCCVM